jgi:hypothetical protein
MIRLGVSLQDEAKIQAVNVLMRLWSGEPPIVERFEDHVEIDFTPEQRILLQDTLARWHEAEPGPIRINVRSVLLPFYLKKYGPHIAVLTAGALLVGSVLLKRR